MANIQLSEKHTKEFIDNYWLGLGDISKIKTDNIFEKNELFLENPTMALIDIMRKPENFGFACQFLFNKTLAPLQTLTLQCLWTHTFPMLIGSRGFGKTFSLALYCLLVALFKPGSKIVITGTSFRQAKIVFSYIEDIYRNSPILKDILSVDKNNRPMHDTDMYSFRIGESVIIAIPTGDGSKIRGLRANCLVVEEFNTIDIGIFEEVIQGFGSVSLSPVENIIQFGRLEAFRELGKITTEELEQEAASMSSNQQILSGTCGFTFQNFYKYWKKYHDIILSKGETKKLEDIFNGQIPPGTNWKDYAIVRFPFTLLPRKFMDEKVIGKAKATANSSIYLAEYEACFPQDSDGFFRRSLIESCVCRNTNPPISKPSCGVLEFNVSLRGERDKKYVIACDPAAAKDNLAIKILEIHPDHRRIKYGWTTDLKRHKQKLKYGLVKDHDYYRYCARKIRDLKKVFPCDHIVLDAQGGGQAIKEILGDPSCLEPGEHPIYPIIEDNVDKDTDNLPGEHILYMIEFANADWVYNANHNLKKDMETCELVFPLKDSLAYGLAREDDKIHKRIIISEDEPEKEGLSDTLEDVLLEIEELKNELTIIEHSQTPSGRDKWDTPQIKSVGMRKGHLRKDRYSALLMANAVGRTFIPRLIKETYPDYGGTAASLAKGKKNKQSSGQEFGLAVRRGQRRF